MGSLEAQVLAQIRLAEGWSVGNVLGALLLGIVALGLLAFALLVTLRR
jgi:hypothetical protein